MSRIIPITPIRDLIPASVQQVLRDIGILSNEDAEASFLDKIFYRTFSARTTDDELVFHIDLVILDEVAIPVPGLDGFSFILRGGDVQGVSIIPITVSWKFQIGGDQSHFRMLISDVQLALRFPRGFLKPVGETQEAVGDCELTLRGAFSIDWEDNQLHIDFDASEGVSLNRSMIGDSGVIISATNVKLNLKGANRGLFFDEVLLEFPPDLQGIPNIAIKDCRIDSNGFTGSVSAIWDPSVGGELLGFKIFVEQLGLTFVSNKLIDSLFRGTIVIPFFDDPKDSHPVGFSASIGSGGNFMIGLAAPENAESIASVDLGPVNLGVRKILFEKTPSSGSYMLMSSRLTVAANEPEPLSFDIEDLKVFSSGRVEFKGGWFDVKDLLTIEKSGFRIGITKLGIGFDTAEGGKNFVGFSGGIQVAGSFAAAVEGAQFIWWKKAGGGIESKFRIQGAELAFVVSDIFGFGAKMVFFEKTDPSPFGQQSIGEVSGLMGQLKLALIPFKFSIEGQFIVGRVYNPKYVFWMAVLDVNLPAGIPLGSTGIAVYGFSGLIAANMKPNKAPEEHWYRDWYKKPQIGATDVLKWIPEPDAFAVGIGAFLGTQPDNGYAFSAKALLLVSTAGPQIILAGKVNLLKNRMALLDPALDPLFSFLLVYDNTDKSLLFALEVNYTKKKILTLAGVAEVFFSFEDSRLWHIYVGEKPPEKRIQAEILELFKANAYFMIDNKSVAFGFFIGYKPDPMKFGPIAVAVKAYIAADALISWDPQLYSGSLEAVGELSIKIFFFSLGLSLRALVEAAGPKPWMIGLEAEIKINLPWPLPDPEATVRILYEQEIPPPFQDPFSAVEFDDHTAIRGSKSYPVYENVDDLENAEIADRKSVLVPMDGVFCILFNRIMGIADNVSLVAPTQSCKTIVGKNGVKYEFTNKISRFQIKRVNGPVVQSGDLRNTWNHEQDADEESIQKSILQLNTNNPYHVERMVENSNWIVTDPLLYRHYFCPQKVTEEGITTCWKAKKYLDYMYIIDEYKDKGFTIRVEEGVLFGGFQHFPENLVEELIHAFGKQISGILTAYNTRVEIIFDRETHQFEIEGANKGRLNIIIFSGPTELKRIPFQSERIEYFELKSTDLLGASHPAITKIILEGTEIYLHQICHISEKDWGDFSFSTAQRAYIRSLRESWETAALLFDPHTIYEVSLRTTVQRRRLSSGSDLREVDYPEDRDRVYYFKTGGSPDDLTRHVKHSIPQNNAERFFRRYCIDVQFIANHVPLMYLKDGDHPLFLYITTAGGDPIRDPSGNIIRDEFGNPLLRLRYYPVEQTYVLSECERRFLTVSSCGEPQAASGVSSMRVIRFNPGEDQEYLLEPESRYVCFLGSEAHVETSEDGAQRLKRLYEFSFTTSRFEDFKSLIEASPKIETHNLLDLRDYDFSPTKKILSEPEREREEIESIYDGHAWFDEIGEDILRNTCDRDKEHKDHQRLRVLLGINPYLQPQSTEIYELRDDLSHFGFLLQFVEPIDWNRTLLTGTLVRTELENNVKTEYPSEVGFKLIRNYDGTAAFLRFKPGIKILYEQAWIQDFLDRTTNARFRNLVGSIIIRPLDKIHSSPISKTRNIKGQNPSSRSGKSRPKPEMRSSNAESAKKTRGIVFTVFSIIPAMFRLLAVWLTLVVDRLRGHWATKEKRIELNDLKVRLSLHICFKYTRDFSDRDHWDEYEKELPIIARQGDDNSFEIGALTASYDHLEEVA